MKTTSILLILFITFCVTLAGDQKSNTKSSKNQNVKLEKKVNNLLKFGQKYGKSYGSKNQYVYRDTVFKKNLNFIEENNKNRNSNFKMGVTQFSDLTESQFQQLVLMPKSSFKQSILPPPKVGFSLEFVKTHFSEILKPSTPTSAVSSNPPTVSITKSQSSSISSIVPIDWVSKGVSGIVKQQGICGSCYAFSALGAIQGMILANNLDTIGILSYNLDKHINSTFSEQHIVDCCNIPKKCDMGCEGGYVWSVFDFIKTKGIILQYNYPYQAIQNTVRKCESPLGLYTNVLDVDVPYFNVSKGNVTQLIEALRKGPVSVLVDATYMQFYVSDDSSSSIPFSNCSNTNHNHAVLLVGVDKNGNWLIKNSWGTQWGDKGYITLAAGNTCGIADYATYPNSHPKFRKN